MEFIETEFSEIIESDYKRFTSELKIAANYIILFKSLILSFKCKKIGEGKGFHGINELVDSSTKKFRSVLGNKHRNAELNFDQYEECLDFLSGKLNMLRVNDTINRDTANLNIISVALKDHIDVDVFLPDI